MKKTFSIFLLVAALFLCSCEKADIVIRTDLDGAKTTDFTETTEAPVQTDAEGKYTVVLNKSSGVFHVSQDCYHAKIMKEENRNNKNRRYKHAYIGRIQTVRSMLRRIS